MTGRPANGQAMPLTLGEVVRAALPETHCLPIHHLEGPSRHRHVSHRGTG